MPVIPVDSLDDPRVAPYRALKDRELARSGDRFIAEGEHVVRRLIESDYPVESLLLARKRAAAVAPLAPPDVPAYVVDDALIHGVVGYKFHSGVMAVGRRKPPLSLDAFMAARAAAQRLTLVVLPDIANTENLGSLVRITAAFGADALVLGQHSCDPFWRQAVRVSMGTIFSLPLVRSDDLLADLHALRGRWGVELAAAVVGESAEPLAHARRGERLGLLFGNEAQGLGADYVAACHRRVTIPMHLGTDSLNVAVAAAVFLYHFTGDAGGRSVAAPAPDLPTPV
jgi:tRNA G18 (ribose-2'-O)-methylase SpoU